MKISHITFLLEAFGSRVLHSYMYLQGSKCCSEIAIAFHEMEGNRLYLMEYLIYHLEAAGIRKIAKPKDSMFFTTTTSESEFTESNFNN